MSKGHGLIPLTKACKTGLWCVLWSAPKLSDRLSKRSRRRWFETTSRSLWNHCNVVFHEGIVWFVKWKPHHLIIQHGNVINVSFTIVLHVTSVYSPVLSLTFSWLNELERNSRWFADICEILWMKNVCKFIQALFFIGVFFKGQN